MCDEAVLYRPRSIMVGFAGPAHFLSVAIRSRKMAPAGGGSGPAGLPCKSAGAGRRRRGKQLISDTLSISFYTTVT